MAGSYITRADIPTGDIYNSPSSDDDSEDDEFPPLEAFRTIIDEMKKDESLGFIEVGPRSGRETVQVRGS